MILLDTLFLTTLFNEPCRQRSHLPVGDHPSHHIPAEEVEDHVTIVVRPLYRPFEFRIIIVGFGLNGKNLARAARVVGIPYTIIEMNPAGVRTEKAENPSSSETPPRKPFSCM